MSDISLNNKVKAIISETNFGFTSFPIGDKIEITIYASKIEKNKKVNATVISSIFIFPKLKKYNVCSQDIRAHYTNRDATLDALAVLFNQLECLHDKICTECELKRDAV